VFKFPPEYLQKAWPLAANDLNKCNYLSSSSVKQNLCSDSTACNSFSMHSCENFGLMKNYAKISKAS